MEIRDSYLPQCVAAFMLDRCLPIPLAPGKALKVLARLYATARVPVIDQRCGVIGHPPVPNGHIGVVVDRCRDGACFDFQNGAHDCWSSDRSSAFIIALPMSSIAQGLTELPSM